MDHKTAEEEFTDLWEKNVVLIKIEGIGWNVILIDQTNEYPTFDIKDRNPYFVFKSQYLDGKEWQFDKPDEVKRIIELIPELPDRLSEKIRLLFDKLPFWLYEFKAVENFMFEIEKEYVIKMWKPVKLLIELGEQYHRYDYKIDPKLRAPKRLITPNEYSVYKYYLRTKSYLKEKNRFLV